MCTNLICMLQYQVCSNTTYVSTVEWSIAVTLGFVDMTESAQTVRAVGPCLVIVVDRTLLHRSLLI